jgi:AcrR family transcriptional regulator
MTHGVSNDNSTTDRPEASTSARERILREATRLFARNGYEGTSLRMLADAVGMQKGSLVYHFESKEGIREAVLAGLVVRWKDVLPQIMRAATSGENRFERTMAEITGFFTADPNRARLLLREALDNPRELRERLTGATGPWIDLVPERIRDGQSGGEIHAAADAPAYIWLVVLMVLASTAMGELGPGLPGDADPQPATERLTEELIRMARTALFRQPTNAATAAGSAARTGA